VRVHLLMTRMVMTRRLALAAIALLFLVSGCPKKTADVEIIVGAAASLRSVMPDLMTAYAKDHVRLTASYGASGDLRNQVQGGAPIDVVVFASGKPVDDLIKEGLADSATRKVVATNAIILIGPKNGGPYKFMTLATLPSGEKIAIGDPKTVPAGQYAQAALEKLGEWDKLRDKFVFAGDVAGVLAYVRRGEVAAGIVYKTEALHIDDVRVLDELAATESGPRPEVVAAVTAGSKAAAEARGFVDFLSTPPAAKLFVAYGFGAP
jgi:molybdate transport system substrate-binding protein